MPEYEPDEKSRKASEVMAVWLKTRRWDWIGHFTFSRNLQNEDSAIEYFRAVIAHQDADLKYFAFLERHAYRQALHIHALIGNVGSLERMSLIQGWKDMCGICRVEKYDEKLAGVFYVSKRFAKPGSASDTNLDMDFLALGQSGIGQPEELLLKEGDKRIPIDVSRIEIKAVKQDGSLVGFAACVLNEIFYIGGIGIHIDNQMGGYRLAYPTKVLKNGVKILLCQILSVDGARKIQEAVISEWKRAT